jgi:hypothetical protein
MQQTNDTKPEITVPELKARFIEEVKQTMAQIDSAKKPEIKRTLQSILILYTIVGPKIGLVTDEELEKLFTDAAPSGLILPDQQLAK